MNYVVDTKQKIFANKDQTDVQILTMATEAMKTIHVGFFMDIFKLNETCPIPDHISYLVILYIPAEVA